MPQNSNLSEAWQQELGENFQKIQAKYLQPSRGLLITIGLLLPYNPTLSDHPFRKKQLIEGGFCDSPLRLNRSLAQENDGTNCYPSEGGRTCREGTKIWTRVKR